MKAILLIIILAGCVSKRDFETRIAELEKTIHTKTYFEKVNDTVTFGAPYYWDSGLLLTGRDGIVIKPSDNNMPGPTGWVGGCAGGVRGVLIRDSVIWSSGIGIPLNDEEYFPPEMLIIKP